MSIPERADVPDSDKWNLSSLYHSDAEWEDDMAALDALVGAAAAFQGRLGESAETLLDALRQMERAERLLERLYNYASLQHSADEDDAAAAAREGRAGMAYTDFSARTSFFGPEVQSLPEEAVSAWLELPEFADYRVYLKKLLRLKPYILGEKEERLLSLQGESARTAYRTFSLLENVDMNGELGSVETPGGAVPLSSSSFVQLLHHSDRDVRRRAYRQYYEKIGRYQNTIASLYSGSVQQDVFEACARGYSSSLDAALFGSAVPQSVYRNLISCVHEGLPALHSYYALRKKVLGVDELRHYDVYVPLVKDVAADVPYEEAVEICRQALSPLGTDYTDRLCAGLLGGWADRYENKGKRSGAFSSGVYTGDPYILLNYKRDILRDVYTVAHEGGHSMHTWYSVQSNPFMQYNYTIFEAEVASTFNEELVFRHLFKNAADGRMKAYLLALRIDDILATLHRQTMFAEYELKAHELVEQGTPLTAELLRSVYRGLLEQYFGPEMRLDDVSSLEAFRIPHFYTAFYVYKYATGIAASLALAKRVLGGGEAEREDYFRFLRSGGSRYPIESLRVAGVDMERTEPVRAALAEFASMVGELERLLRP